LALQLTQPLIHWVQRPFSTEVKQTRQDADHISPSRRMSSAILLTS